MSFLVCFYTFLALAVLSENEATVVYRKSVGNAQLTFEMDDIQDVDQLNEGLEFTAKRRNKRSQGDRPGSATDTNTCKEIRAIPAELRLASNMKPNGLSSFYSKYTEAYGIPVIASSKVPDAALQRACYVLRFLLADHSEIRKSFYKLYGRVGIMASTEQTTDIPEHSWLPADPWDARARGLGATVAWPISTGAEENLLCFSSGDRYPNEDIFLHEFAHGVHLLGAHQSISGWTDRLTSLYNQRKADNQKWANTYAMSTVAEYFAEGVQSYFNVNDYAKPANGIHNEINTRSKLKSYDPELFSLIKEVFPCSNKYIKRCKKSRSKEQKQKIKMDCNPEPKPDPVDPSCTDDDANCSSWAGSGECTKNPAFMIVSCKKSCGKCGGVEPDPVDPSCKDSNTSCESWAALGECTKNPAYMLVNCKRSCNKC